MPLVGHDFRIFEDLKDVGFGLHPFLVLGGEVDMRSNELENRESGR